MASDDSRACIANGLVQYVWLEVHWPVTAARNVFVLFRQLCCHLWYQWDPACAACWSACLHMLTIALFKLFLILMISCRSVAVWQSFLFFWICGSAEVKLPLHLHGLIISDSLFHFFPITIEMTGLFWTNLHELQLLSLPYGSCLFATTWQALGSPAWAGSKANLAWGNVSACQAPDEPSCNVASGGWETFGDAASAKFVIRSITTVDPCNSFRAPCLQKYSTYALVNSPFMMMQGALNKLCSRHI